MSVMECFEVLDRAFREQWDLMATSTSPLLASIFEARRRLILCVLERLEEHAVNNQRCDE